MVSTLYERIIDKLAGKQSKADIIREIKGSLDAFREEGQDKTFEPAQSGRDVVPERDNKTGPKAA